MRGTRQVEGLGDVKSWEFGFLTPSNSLFAKIDSDSETSSSTHPTYPYECVSMSKSMDSSLLNAFQNVVNKIKHRGEEKEVRILQASLKSRLMDFGTQTQLHQNFRKYVEFSDPLFSNE